MIASVRGVIAAWVIAALLAVAALATGRREAAPPDRALFPGLGAESVTTLAWVGGEAPVRITRDPGSPTGWVWAAPRGAADARAVEDVLAALRGGRWHRRAPAAAAGPITSTLTVTGGPGADRVPPIGVGAPLPGAEQRWLAIGARAYLVDAWLARALAPEPLALRLRRPLAGAGAAARVEIALPAGAGRVVLAGAPRRMEAPHALLLDPRPVAELEQALAELELVELPRVAAAPLAGGLAVTAARVTLADAGPCPGAPARRAVDGTAGPGCVEGAAWERARRALEALSRPPAELVERRPAPLEVARVVLLDGAALELSGQPRVGGRDADPAAALELVATLAAPAEPVALAAPGARPPGARPLGALTVSDRGGRAITLELYAPDRVARRAEPVALRVGEAALRRLTRPASELRDPTPWREDPTTIAAIIVDGTTYARGAVLGEWTRAGPGRDDPAAVSALAAALAAPAARAPAATASAPRHTVTLRVLPPGGAPVTHALRLAAPAAAGCPALIEGAPPDEARVVLPAEVCALVGALSR